MAGVIEVLWLGFLLGVGAALSVGPIFVVIVQQAATSGFGASFRVILGSATADLILLLPALAFAWIIRSLERGALWVGTVGALFLLYLAWRAARDALALWRENRQLLVDGRWAFWKGVAGNLANPLTWTFWLATGTPAMLAAQQAAGPAGLVVFTATWFLVASGLEAVIALAVARSRRLVGARGQAWLTAVSAVAFLGLAATLLARDVLPRLG
ncbi:MAG TPA: LysE family transporter [Actinomycetota bacterium]|jgi:threonine/homoserine/homoserine lactone efflux protein|nr:LysE family transporter [Actinomycetota bacterium]